MFRSYALLMHNVTHRRNEWFSVASKNNQRVMGDKNETDSAEKSEGNKREQIAEKVR